MASSRVKAAKNKVKWSELLGALAAGNSIPCNDTEREEIETIIRKLENVGESLPSDLDSYTRWAPRVGCFSFDWHKPLPRRRSATVGN